MITSLIDLMAKYIWVDVLVAIDELVLQVMFSVESVVYKHFVWYGILYFKHIYSLIRKPLTNQSKVTSDKTLFYIKTIHTNVV